MLNMIVVARSSTVLQYNK